MITIEGLHKSYGSRDILKGVDLTIADGEIFGIVGMSGAGKSTVLRCLNGTEPYDSGTVSVDGRDVGSMNRNELRHLRRDMGFIFQQFSLMERDTVSQNIARPMRCWKYPKPEIAERVDELLRIVGLEEKRDSKPRELSGGQKQRVAIARALAMKPKSLLCDEATSALDPQNTRSVLDVLKEINRDQGVTIVVVTHEMSVVKEICDKMAILENGVVVAQGSVQKIFAQNPKALVRLIGGQEYESLPQEGHVFRVGFTDQSLMNDVIKAVVSQSGTSILNARVETFRSGKIGELVIGSQSRDVCATFEAFSGKGLYWEQIHE